MYFLRHFVFTSCSLDVKAQLTSFVTFLFSSNKNYLVEKIIVSFNNIFSDTWAITFLLVIKLKLVQITDKSKDWCQYLIMRLKFVQTIQVRKGSLIPPYLIVQEVIEISLFIVLHDSATKMTLKCFRSDHYACILKHD